MAKLLMKATMENLKFGKDWCNCGDEISVDGANGQCWICRDINPNEKNKLKNKKDEKIKSSP